MGQKLGKYEITEKLGEGAMGAVFKAYDEMLDRYVAVKTMAADIKWDPELKLRFYREARSAASLHHPNIVTIHDLGEEAKVTYIVMELLEGKDLKAIIRDKDPLPLEQKLSIMAQVADGLNHAHKNGIIHRDVKPGNIHVSPTGNVKILDFGIARIPSSDLTRQGVRLGTPVYMSPEQIRGVEYDERSDIFSTGIVYYEFLTYAHPFRDKNIVKTMDNILFQTHFPFAEQLPEAPAGLWPILNNCLAKEPEKRYSSMSDVGRACRRLIDDLNLAAQKAKADLEAILPRLRAAAAQPSAPPKLGQLYHDARALLSAEDRPDWITLQRLMSGISDLLPGGPAVRGPEAGTTAGTRTGYPEATAARQAPTEFPSRTAAPGYPAATAPAETHAAPAPPTPSVPAAEEIRGRDLMQQAEALVKESRYQEAVDILRQAMGFLGPKDDLIRLLTEARKRMEEQKKARVGTLLALARDSVAARNYPKAAEALDEVLQLEPEQREAAELRGQVRKEMEAEKSRQSRAAEGEREKILGYKLLADKKYRDSLVSLNKAKDMIGDDQSLLLGIEEAQDGLRHEEMLARIQSDLAETETLLKSEEFEKARLKANAVLDASPGNPEALSLLARIEKSEDEKQLRDEIAGYCRQSEAALGRNDFEEAVFLASEALRLSPGDKRAEELLQRIETVREKIRREQEALQLVLRGQQADSAQDFDQAIAAYESALRVDPQNAQATTLLQQARQARENREKEKQVAAAFSEARQAFEQGNLDASEEQARHILTILPLHAGARDLVVKVTDAREKARKQKIASLLEQGKLALTANDFPGARSRAQEALQIDPDCAEAAALIQEAFAAEQKQRQEKINGLLTRSRAALERNEFAEATELANQVTALDEKNKDAKSLIKTVEKARRAAEKEAKKKKAAPPKPQPAIPGDSTWIMPEQPKAKSFGKLVLWACLGLLVIGGAFGALYYLRPRPKPVDVSAQLAAARTSLDQKRYDAAMETAQRILDTSPGNADAAAILAEAQKNKKQTLIESLLMEAQTLRGQKQFAEAGQALQKIFDLDPSNGPALEVKNQIEADVSASKSSEEQDKLIKQWLDNAKALIAAGKLAEAKTEVAKIEQLRPNTPDLPAFRKQLKSMETKSSVAELDRKQKEQESGQKQARLAEIRRRPSELVAQGKYTEAVDAIGEWLKEEPQNAQAHALKSQVDEALRSLKAFESALSEKRYEEALNAAAALQKINPSDPRIADWKRRVEDSRASAKATLSVYRLGEAAPLALDDQPLGANGEVEGKTIPIGKHKLSVKNAQGKQSIINVEFLDGQKAEYVYDAAIPDLRVMAAATDRALIEKRKSREETRSFAVEHNHGTLRGKCKGTLAVSAVNLIFTTTESDHGFTWSFRQLKLVAKDDRSFDITGPDNKKATFRLAEPSKATEFKQFWEKLVQTLK
jgi:hypothetical protein